MSQTAQLIGDLRSPDEDLPGVVSIRREARHFERQASSVSAASASIPAQPAQPAQPFGPARGRAAEKREACLTSFQ